VARHSDSLVGLQRFADQISSLFSITSGTAIHQHHGMEATYLRLFETVRNRLGLLA
jgi:hypothetical protein